MGRTKRTAEICEFAHLTVIKFRIRGPRTLQGYVAFLDGRRAFQ